MKPVSQEEKSWSNSAAQWIIMSAKMLDKLSQKFTVEDRSIRMMLHSHHNAWVK